VAAKKKEKERFSEIRNSKVYRNFEVGEKLEAGIALQGTEVKSIRAGKAQISESFVRIDQGIPIIYHAHIDEYTFGNLNNHNPLRPRKLLLHKKQIGELEKAVDTQGTAIIPTRMYIKKGLIKVEIAICKGKKLFDKREDLKKKSEMRDAERAMRSFNR